MKTFNNADLIAQLTKEEIEEADKNPRLKAITERGDRFRNGTETAEDLAWLEESKKESPSYLGMIIDHQSPLHPMYGDLKKRGFIDSDPD